MKMLNQPKFFAFMILIAVLLLGLLYVYILMPIQKDNGRLAGEAQRKQKELAALENRPGQRSEDNPGNFVRLLRVRTQIPEEPYPEQLLRDLRQMEAAGGVQMKYYNIQTGSQALQNEIQTAKEMGGLLYPVTVTTEFTGGYSQIKRLLREVNVMNRIWQVRNLSLVQPVPTEWVGIHEPDRLLNCQITLAAYYAPGLGEYFNKTLPVVYDKPAAAGGTPF